MSKISSRKYIPNSAKLKGATATRGRVRMTGLNAFFSSARSIGKLNRRSKRASCVAHDGLLLLMKAVLRAVGAAMRMQRNARYYQQETPADVTSMPRTAIKRSPSRSLMVIIEPKRVLKTGSPREQRSSSLRYPGI